MLKAEEVKVWVVGFLADLLDVDPSEIKSDVRFNLIGLDSVDAVVVAGAMEEHFDTEINAALFLRNLTIDSLIDDLRASGIVE